MKMGRRIFVLSLQGDTLQVLGAATAAPGRTPCVLKGRQRALFGIGGI